MSIIKHVVYLTDDELVLLDQKCSPDVQRQVDSAKKRIEKQNELSGVDKNIAGFIANIISYATNQGKLIFEHKQLKSCDVCGKRAGYAKRTRSTKYYKKGELNYDKPLYLNGIELADNFITFKGSASLGCCTDCWNVTKPLLKDQLNGIRAQIPYQIMDEDSKYIKYQNRRCDVCGWEGHEGQMIKLPALFGGYYPGKCPKCNSENRLFTNNISVANSFTIVEKDTKNSGELK